LRDPLCGIAGPSRGGHFVDVTAGQRLFDLSAGERTVPGIWHENYWFRRHEACYDAIGRLTGMPPGSRVLDAGSGEGFGAARLHAEGHQVVALDYDAFAVEHHARRYPQVPGLRGNLVALPLLTGSVDLLVSLQTVEHLWDQSGFVAECARVLRRAGRLVLSTPNRLTFPPGNVFHHRELDATELEDLVARYAADVSVHGLTHGPRLTEWESRHGSLVEALVTADPEAWPAQLRTLVRSVTAADFVLTDDVDACLDLVAVAVAR
jgi:SAM-dependent methyltransferase